MGDLVTTPGGGDINLATLWIPVVPETSQLGPKLREAGEQGRRDFEEGFTSGGSSSVFDRMASQLSSRFSDQITQGLQQGLSRMELPGGMERVTESLMRGFEGMRGRTEAAEQALRNYEQAHERLTAALDREAVAQSRVNDLRERGAQGTQMLSAVASLEAAHRRVAQSATDDAAAHETFTKTLDSGKTSLTAFAAETGVVGGVVTAAITLSAEAISKLVEASVEGFEKVVETGEEVAKEVVEIGEKFEELHRSIELSTIASGSALDELKVHADALVSTLDTSSDKLGTDISVLASRLNMEAGPALDKLTHDVEELRDRFGSLDVTALAGAFDQFGISGEHADETLASLVHSARQFGVGLNQLVTDLAEAGPTLQEFNLSAEQSGHLLAELEAKHINAAGAVNMLAKAEKAAGEQHRDIKEFVQSEIQIIEQYAESGNKAAADQEAFLAFGAKGWVQATQAAKAYLETLNAGPDAYKGNTAEMQHLIATTQSLENRWEALRNKMTVAFAPLASVALDKINEAISKLGEWIQGHEGQILGFVKRLGEDFINALPAVQTFAEGAIDALKPMAEVFQYVAHLMIYGLSGMLEVASKVAENPLFKHIFGGDLSKELNEMGVAVAKAGKAFGELDIGGVLGRANDAIKGFRFDTQGMTKDLDDSTDAIKRQLDALNTESSATGGAGGEPGQIGHIAPPASSFGGQPPDGSEGAEPGGEGAQPGGDQPPDSGATQVQPRSWHMQPPPNDGVGGPQHVRLAGWHPGVEQVDSHGGRQFSEGGGHGGGEHHGDLFRHHQPQHVGPTPQQDRQHTRRLEDLQDRIDDADASIPDLTDKKSDASGKLQHDEALRDSYQQGSLTWIAENKAVIADQRAYAAATKELTRALRERKRGEEDLADENQKFKEEQQKGHGGKAGESGGSPAEDFGKNFLSGLMSDFGIGNVFGGKSPLDWALPKMLEGALGWGLNALGGGGGGGEGGAGAGAGAGGGGGSGLLGPLRALISPNAANPSGGGGPAATPFIFGSQGQAFGPEGTAPGPGQGVAHLPGAPAAPGTNARHPAPPAAPPGDSVIPGAPTPTPVPTPHAALQPGMHFTGFDSGGGAAAPGGLSQAGWHAAMPAVGGGGGAQTAGYTAAAAPRMAQLASAVGVPLTHNPDGTVTSPNAVWAHLLQRESGGRNVRQGIVDANSGGNEAEGFFQITPATWRSHGGGEFAPNPLAANAEQQAAVAARILQANPSGSDWGAGGPGREDAGALLSGLNIDPTAAGGGAPYTPAAFPPAGLGGDEPMQQRWAAAMQRGAIGPHGELAPGTAAGSEAGLQQNTIRGRRIMSALFPELQDIGGVRQDSLKWHPQGLALDLMIPGQGGLNTPTTPQGRALGDQINQFITQNAGALGSDYTMWQQPDHYNHVHANFGASGYPADPNEQYFVPQGLMPQSSSGGANVFAPAGFQNTAAVPGGPAQPPAITNSPNINPMMQPHYTGPTLPGPVQQQPNASSGVNIQSNPQGSSAQQAVGGLMSGLFSLAGSLIGNPDFNARNWQGILHEPDWSGVQHQHQPVQSAQSIVQNFDHSIDMSGSTVANPAALQQSVQEMQNARFNSIAGGMPMPSIGSP